MCFFSYYLWKKIEARFEKRHNATKAKNRAVSSCILVLILKFVLHDVHFFDTPNK
jgi:hypothetical protein